MLKKHFETKVIYDYICKDVSIKGDYEKQIHFSILFLELEISSVVLISA